MLALGLGSNLPFLHQYERPPVADTALGAGPPVHRETGLQDAVHTLWRGERTTGKQRSRSVQSAKLGRRQGGTSGELTLSDRKESAGKRGAHSSPDRESQFKDRRKRADLNNKEGRCAREHVTWRLEGAGEERKAGAGHGCSTPVYCRRSWEANRREGWSGCYV